MKDTVKVNCSFDQAVQLMSAAFGPVKYYLHNSAGSRDWSVRSLKYPLENRGEVYITVRDPAQLTFFLLKHNVTTSA